MTTDWRGTEIEVGDTVIYGAGFGSHGVEMVEAEVVGFTDTGRVRLRVIRRSRTSFVWHSDRETTDVAPDRLTVVNGLPPTDLPTRSEQIAKAKADWAARNTA